MIQGKVVSGKIVAFLTVATSLSALSCVAPTGGQPAREDNPDAAVAFRSSALVTSPATWQNLWGSWPLVRFDECR